MRAGFCLSSHTAIAPPCGVTFLFCRRQSETTQTTKALVRLILSGLSVSILTPNPACCPRSESDRILRSDMAAQAIKQVTPENGWPLGFQSNPSLPLIIIGVYPAGNLSAEFT